MDTLVPDQAQGYLDGDFDLADLARTATRSVPYDGRPALVV
jgi:hypothetical protein